MRAKNDWKILLHQSNKLKDLPSCLQPTAFLLFRLEHEQVSDLEIYCRLDWQELKQEKFAAPLNRLLGHCFIVCFLITAREQTHSTIPDEYNPLWYTC